MQVIHLVSVWSSGDKEESETLHKKLDEKIDNYAAGELEHAAEAVSSIWELSRKKETLPSISRGQETIPSTRNFPRRPPSQGHHGWTLRGTTQQENSMRTSLIWSIQGGSFLNRKYWARRSRGGSMCPIYFPGATSNLTSSPVAACE